MVGETAVSATASTVTPVSHNAWALEVAGAPLCCRRLGRLCGWEGFLPDDAG